MRLSTTSCVCRAAGTPPRAEARAARDWADWDKDEDAVSSTQ